MAATCCSPELAAALYPAAAGSKEVFAVVIIQHIGLYDAERHVGPTAAAAAGFLNSHL
jgi:hypothetical protein